jgi:hypothetical protein
MLHKSCFHVLVPKRKLPCRMCGAYSSYSLYTCFAIDCVDARTGERGFVICHSCAVHRSYFDTLSADPEGKPVPKSQAMKPSPIDPSVQHVKKLTTPMHLLELTNAKDLLQLPWVVQEWENVPLDSAAGPSRGSTTTSRSERAAARSTRTGSAFDAAESDSKGPDADAVLAVELSKRLAAVHGAESSGSDAQMVDAEEAVGTELAQSEGGGVSHRRILRELLLGSSCFTPSEYHCVNSYEIDMHSNG